MFFLWNIFLQINPLPKTSKKHFRCVYRSDKREKMLRGKIYMGQYRGTLLSPQKSSCKKKERSLLYLWKFRTIFLMFCRRRDMRTTKSDWDPFCPFIKYWGVGRWARFGHFCSKIYHHCIQPSIRNNLTPIIMSFWSTPLGFNIFEALQYPGITGQNWPLSREILGYRDLSSFKIKEN